LDDDCDTRIRNQNVQPAMALLDLRDDFNPACLAGDVLMKKHRLLAGFLDFGDKFQTAKVVYIGHGYRSALASQQLRDCGTNTGCAASHHRYLSLDLPRHFRSCQLLSL
jgi:hypothetical protein